MVYGTLFNYSIHGVYKPTHITGGHHPVWVMGICLLAQTWLKRIPSGNLLQFAIEKIAHLVRWFTEHLKIVIFHFAKCKRLRLNEQWLHPSCILVEKCFFGSTIDIGIRLPSGRHTKNYGQIHHFSLENSREMVINGDFPYVKVMPGTHGQSPKDSLQFGDNFK